MKELPENTFFEGFYIWFNKDEKIEYYSTSLYLYGTIRTDDIENKQFSIKLKNPITYFEDMEFTKELALKHPATISNPYYESIGNMLVSFLNASFENFQSAYNSFLYAYGFELLKDYNFVELKGRYNSELELLKELEKAYLESRNKLKEIHKNIKKCVDFIYNLNGVTELEDKNRNAKFVSYAIKNDMYTYSKDIEVIRGNYIMKHHENINQKLEKLVDRVENNDTALLLTNYYTSSNIASILFVILEQITKMNNVIIKECQNCGKYFIPSFRESEVYCNFENLDGSPTCKEKGATESYKKNLEASPALYEYRRQYQQKVSNVYRHKDDKKAKISFNKWKDEAQTKIKEFKQGNLSESVLYQWLIDNK